MMNPHNKKYRFAVLSDIHIDLENGGKNTYFIHAERNFARALEVIRQENCSFIISAGDQVTNAAGSAEEWRRYRELIKSSGYEGLIFEALGNHETRSAKYGINTLQECLDDFIRCSRLNEKPVLRDAGKTYYEYTEPVCGDVFLFLALENGVSTNRIDNFSDEQMDWAEARLRLHRQLGRRVFLIQHANLYRFGPGDDCRAPAYEGAIRMQDEEGKPFPNNRRFRNLLNAYPELIWLSGHTHLDLRAGFNFTDSPCRMIHIPTLAGCTRMIYDADGAHTIRRRTFGDAAQGYIVDVDSERIVFRGIDFTEHRFYPEYTYCI